MRLTPSVFVLAALLATPAAAGEAEIVAVTPTPTGVSGDVRIFRFEVTVRHADAGWDHYADAWRVVAVDGAAAGSVLGLRTLYHPHVDEQPFTRALDGVAIGADVTRVRVEARDSVHGWGEGVEISLDGVSLDGSGG